MIKAGKAPHVQETPVLNEERNLEDESVEYLDALAKERKLKLDKKWEKVDKRHGLSLKDKKPDQCKDYLLKRLK